MVTDLYMVVLPEDEILEDLSVDFNSGRLVDDQELHNCINSESKYLNIIHLNIRSIKKNIDELILFIENYKLNFNDIIILSECYQILSTDQCNIPGYDTFYNQADFNKNDGVVIFVKSNINVSFSYCKLTNSLATISVVAFSIGDINFRITAAYKPPPIEKQLFVNDLYEYLLRDSNNNHFEFFVGDTNIDLLSKNDNDTMYYLASMAELGYTSYINSVTRVETNTCLDHIFVKQKMKSQRYALSSFILDTYITDHSPIMIHLYKRRTELVGPQAPCELTKTKIDMGKFKNLLQGQDWSQVLNMEDSETASNNFVNIYSQLMEESKTNFTASQNHKTKLKKWITAGLINSIKHRDRLKKKLLKQYDPQLELQYKTYRNYLNKLIKKRKNDYYRNQIELNKNNMKKIYNIIKEATYENKNKTNNISIVGEDGENFSSDLEIADYFNEYFINVGVEMQNKIPFPKQDIDLEPNMAASMFLNPLTENELVNHISSLKNNCSPGYDGVSSIIIKQTCPEIVSCLLHIFNLIFVTGCFPSSFKVSIVNPVLKSGSATSVKNYRPISLITSFAKLFEKCFKDRLMKFLSTNSVLSPNQYGFVGERGTSDAMMGLIENVVNDLNLGRKCIAVFIDLAKAFDTVSHKILLSVLERYGVRGTVLELIKSYLTDRYQMVRINNVLSRKIKIEMGVPQGTVLGPILFIAYINSLLKLDMGGIALSYADDTVLVFNGDTWNEVRNKLVQGFDIVTNWLYTYKLSLNLSKTNYVAFSLTEVNRPTFSSILLSGEEIKELSNVKYLGIIIDKHLKWGPHVDYVANKIRRLIHKFYLLREILNKKLMTIIYKSLVESLIRYGILLWGGLYNNSLYKLNVIQKFILKIIYKKNRRYQSSLLFSENIQNIRSIYLYIVCSYMHKNKNKWSLVNHAYDTRGRADQNIKIPINYNNINLRFVAYIGPKAYNILPREIREIMSKVRFKKVVQGYIYQNFLDRFGFLFS